MFDIIGENKKLYQWDRDRSVSVPDGVSMVRFSNLDHGLSKDIEVVDGVAKIPPELLRISGNLYIWGSDKNNTNYDRNYYVTKSPKPADYIYTAEELKAWEYLQKQIGDLEKLETKEKENLVSAVNYVLKNAGGSISDEQIEQAVNNYLDEHPIKETDPTVPEWAKQPKNTVTRIENTTDTPIYFTEMESGVYVLRGLFHNFNVSNIELKDRETKFNFTKDTLVELFVNPNPDWGEAAVVAMIHEQGKIHNHIVIKSKNTTYNYEWEDKYIEPLNPEGLLQFGVGDTTVPPWEQPSPALLMDMGNGQTPFINFRQTYFELATKKYVDDAITAYDTEAMALLGEDGDGE